MKTSVEELAILGQRPSFPDTLHVGRPNIGDRGRLLGRLNDLLDRRWLTNDGPLVQEFERRVAQVTGARHCVATCSATAALEITVRACGLHGEVLVPSFTFVATAHVLEWQSIEPVFCDIDPESCTIDPDSVEALLSPRTTGILGVHLWGRPCNIERLSAVSRKHGLKLLFDAAHALGCSYRGRMIGGFGDAEIFSFHATKVVNSFEGGAVVTNNDDLADRLRRMRNFGFAGYDRVMDLGINAKMSEMSAAMGITSLESMDEFVGANRRHYHGYRRGLFGIAGVRLRPYPEGESSNFQYIVVTVDEKEAGLSRDQLMEILHAENVFARRYFYPACHRMEPYRVRYPHAGRNLPVTEALASQTLCLPTGSTLTDQNVEEISQIVRLAVDNARELRSRVFGRRAQVPESTIREGKQPWQ